MMKCAKKQKKGISLIVLVITITGSYDKWLKASKIGKVSPVKRIEKLRNIDKVADMWSATFNFRTSIV